MIAYLAAAWSRRQEMQTLAADLEASIPGFTVNSRWIKERRSNNRWSPATNAKINREPKHMERAIREQRAEQDREDVYAANVIIRFTDDLSAPTVPSYLATGSRMVEMGMALARGTKVIVVGGIQTFFDYLPEVKHVKNIPALKRELRRLNALHQA